MLSFSNKLFVVFSFDGLLKCYPPRLIFGGWKTLTVCRHMCRCAYMCIYLCVHAALTGRGRKLI